MVYFNIILQMYSKWKLSVLSSEFWKFFRKIEMSFHNLYRTVEVIYNCKK